MPERPPKQKAEATPKEQADILIKSIEKSRGKKRFTVDDIKTIVSANRESISRNLFGTERDDDVDVVGIVFDNIGKFDDHNAVLDYLSSELPMGDWLYRARVENFRGLTQETVTKIFNTGEGNSFADAFNEHPEIAPNFDWRVLAKTLIEKETDGTHLLLDSRVFLYIPEELHEEILEMVIAKGPSAIDSIKHGNVKFRGLSETILLKLLDYGKDFWSIVDNSVSEIDNDESKKKKRFGPALADKLTQAGIGGLVLGRFKAFSGVDAVEIGKKLVGRKQFYAVLMDIDLFPSNAQKEFIYEAARQGYTSAVRIWENYHRASIMGIDYDKLLSLYLAAPFQKEGHDFEINWVNIYGDREFFLPKLSAQTLKSLFRKTQEINIPEGVKYDLQLDVNDRIEALTGKPEDALLSQLSKLLTREYLSESIINYAKNLEAQKIKLPPELASKGSRPTPQEIVAYLRKEMNEVRHIILERASNPEDLKPLKEEPAGTFARAVLRFDASSWGMHGQDAFNQLIDKLAASSRQTLPEGFSVESVSVLRREAESPKDVKYIGGFVEKWESMNKEVREALVLAQNPTKGMRTLLEEASRTISSLYAQESTQRERLKDKPQALVNIDQKIQLLMQTWPSGAMAAPEQIRLGSREGGRAEQAVNILRAIIAATKQNDEARSLMRKAAFFVAFIQNKQLAEQWRNVPSNQRPSLADIDKLLELVEHTTYQETFAGGGRREALFSQEGLKSLEELLNLSIFKEQMLKMEGKLGKGTTVIDLIPSNGLLLETAGHTGDACYASKYDLISKTFPNITSLTFVQSPKTPDERIAGSCLLIETKAKNGTSLLVIRGLNPIENFINQHDAASFLKALTAYLEPKAKARGQSLAIVIDQARGMAATNRQMMFNYLEGIKKNLKQVELASASDTTFNDYNIVKTTYFVDSSNL